MINNFEEYAECLARISQISEVDFHNVTELLYEVINRGSAIWIIGNGGSASTADHFETDLSFIKTTIELPKVRAYSLCSNNSLITAIANDIGYDNVFSHQIKRKAEAGDVLFVISASGNSANLINAVNFANENEINTISLIGFDGGELVNSSKLSVFCRSEIGLYGPVEDLHLSICHALATSLKNRLVGAAS
jgi:D-sedoheptulose 7-phosphate isomerase